MLAPQPQDPADTHYVLDVKIKKLTFVVTSMPVVSSKMLPAQAPTFTSFPQSRWLAIFQ